MEVYDYRVTLESELNRRQRKNPKYSLRSFARDLKLSPSFLCTVLSKKDGISASKAAELAVKLGLNLPAKKLFVASAEALHARSERSRKRGQNSLLKLAKISFGPDEITLHSFDIVADWYHMAILELLSTHNAQPNSVAWVSEKLNLSVLEAQSALERLIKVGLLKINNGNFEPTCESSTTLDDVPSVAIKRYHRQLLEKAKIALDEQRVNEREISSLTLKFSSSDIARAQEMIRDFQNSFTAEFRKNEANSSLSDKNVEQEEVMCLNVQFFSLLSRESRKR